MIRALAVSDLPRLQQCASDFYRASRHLVEFDIERFCAIWTQLLANGNGVIFADEHEGEIRGVIGGIKHPDIYGGYPVVEEMFWFVRPECRGSGVRLYHAFEAWAREAHARHFQMVHLEDSMPDRLRDFYTRQGLEPIETRYGKWLN